MFIYLVYTCEIEERCDPKLEIRVGYERILPSESFHIVCIDLNVLSCPNNQIDILLLLLRTKIYSRQLQHSIIPNNK